MLVLLCGWTLGAYAQSETKLEPIPMRFMLVMNAGISQYRQPALGFTLAHVGLAGYYVSGMVGIDNIHLKYDFSTAPDGSLIDGDNAGLVPFYTGKRAVNRFSATAGAMVRMGIPLYAYVGGGYGFRTETRELLNRQWVQAASSLGHSGIAEFGLIGRIENLTLMAGYTLFIGRQAHLYHEAKVGIGYTFDKR